MIFAQAIYKMPEFYITFAPKVFFPAFWGQMLPPALCLLRLWFCGILNRTVLRALDT